MSTLREFVRGVRSGWKDGGGIPTWAEWALKLGALLVIAYIIYNK